MDNHQSEPQEIEPITFNGISNLIQKKFDKQALTLFLNELYKDLIRRSGIESKEATLSQLAFLESLNLPMIIAERMFYSFTNNRYAVDITREQYVQGFIDLYSDNIDTRMNIICKIFDFDLNGIVNVDDVTLIFAQFYVLEENSDMNTFNEIKEIIHKDLTPRKKMTISSFKEIMNNYNPDALYLICFYFNLYCPFTDEQVYYFKDTAKSPSIFKRDSPNIIATVNSSKTLGGLDEKIRGRVNVEQTYKLTSYLKKKFQIVIKEEENKKQKVTEEVDNELNDLEMFEQELLTAISKIELSSPSDGNNTTTNNNTENSFSRKGSDAELIGRVGSFKVRYPQYKTINANTNMRGSFLSPNPFARSITRSPNKSPLSQYYKVKSQAPFGKGTSNEFIPKYQNPNNNMEIKVNYYTRSGAVRDCKIIVIDDCLFVHINNGFTYKFLKLISLRFSYVEEIEKCETLSNSTLFRIKISSFINKNYKEIIFSSQDQIEMSSFLHELQLLTNHKELEDKYQKLKEIYRGSMSQLFLGKNIEDNSQVAIKQVSLNALDRKKSYETILWENDILKFLQKSPHPNIVKTYDIYRNQDFFLFVIEYIPSGNLKNYLLENRNKLSFKELRTIMYQIASAVMFIHSHGIVHRDLKPENVLIKKNEKGELIIKLIDFGFGRVLGRLDFVNEPYGTFYYASPEILNKTPYGFKTDIWSLGVIFYLIVVGVNPFGENEKDLKIIQKNINNAIFTFPEGLTIDSKIKEMITQCLSVDQKKRPKIEDITKILL